MGIQAAGNKLGRALGSALGGIVLGLLGYKYLGTLCLVLSFVASAMFMYAFFLIEGRSRKLR